MKSDLQPLKTHRRQNVKKRELKNLRDGMSPEDRIGAWLSAALEDPMVCDEMKQDIKDWFDQTNDRIVRATDFACPRCGHCCQSEHIKTWNQRCEEHPDHQERIISERMIQERMQEEIDELRQALETEREWVGLTEDEIWKCNRASGSAVEFHICYEHQNVLDFAESLEAKLKEKNT